MLPPGQRKAYQKSREHSLAMAYEARATYLHNFHGGEDTAPRPSYSTSTPKVEKKVLIPSKNSIGSLKIKIPPVEERLAATDVQSDEIHIKDSVIERTSALHRTEFGEFLVRRYLRSTREEAGSLDKIMREMKKIDPLYRASSIRSCLTQVWFKVLITLTTLYFGYWLATVTISVSSGVVRSGSTFRFTALKERSGAPSVAPGIAGFEPLLGGCRLTSKLKDHVNVTHYASLANSVTLREVVSLQETPQWSITTEGATIMLNFTKPISMDGWWFDHSFLEPSKHDPLRFIIEMIDDNGKWVTVGYPSWDVNPTGQFVWRDRDSMFRQVYDLRPPEYWTFWAITRPALLFGFFGGACIFMLLEKPHIAAMMIKGCFFALGTTSAFLLIIAVSEILSEEEPHHRGDHIALLQICLSIGSFSVMSLLVFATQILRWRRAIQSLFAIGLHGVVTEAIWRVFFPGAMVGGTRLYITGKIVIAVICVAGQVCYQIKIWSKKGRIWQQNGREHWDPVWFTLMDKEAASIKLLKRLTTAFKPKEHPRQYNRSRSQWFTAKRNSYVHMSPFHSVVALTQGLGMPGVLDKSKPVTSLDQLFAQASGLMAFLQAKARQLAGAHRGQFPMKDQTLVRWNENTNTSDLMRMTLKGSRRAVEKTLRAYLGDVSLLLDICRQTIVFDSVADMQTCIEDLIMDSEVIISRIKNGMDPDNDANATAGYRCVVVNFRIDVSATRLLGIETHVCELKLVHESFYKPTAQDSYKDMYHEYLQLRDVRASEPIWYNCIHRSKVQMKSLLSSLVVLKLNTVHPLNSMPPVQTQSAMSDSSASRRFFFYHRESSGVASSSGMASNKTWYFLVPKIMTTKSPRPGMQPMLVHQGIEDVAHFKPSEVNGVYKSSLVGLFSAVVPEAYPKDSSGKENAQNILIDSEADTEKILWQQFFVSQYINLTLDVGAFMAVRLSKFSTAMASSAGSSAFYTSTPIASAMTRPWFRFIILLLILYFLQNIVVVTSTFRTTWTYSGDTFRFTALETRAGLAPESPGLHSFGLLKDKCHLDSLVGIDGGANFENMTTKGSSITHYFPHEITINGWYIETDASQDPALDPVRFKIEVLNEDGEWFTVGSSSWYHYAQGWIVNLNGYFTTPVQRSTLVEVDLRPSTYLAVYSNTASFFVVPFLSLMLAMAFAEQYQYLNLLASIVTVIIGISYNACAVVAVVDGNIAMASSMFVYGVVNVSSGILLYFDVNLSRIILMAGIGYNIGWIVDFSIHDGANARAISDNTEFVGMTYILVSLFIMATRKITLAKAEALVKNDQILLNSKWADTISVPGVKEDINSLTELCASVSKSLKPEFARQCNRANFEVDRSLYSPDYLPGLGLLNLPWNRLSFDLAFDTRSVVRRISRANSSNEVSQDLTMVENESHLHSPNSRNEGSTPRPNSARERKAVTQWNALTKRQAWLCDSFESEKVMAVLLEGNRGTVDLKNPITSIDQLYAQAAGLHTVLLQKVQAWALQNSGSFFRNGGGFVPWKEAAVEPELAQQIKWGSLKSPTRAVEKLLRSYQGNVSMLLDLCRQSIAFDHVEDLLGCLKDILSDNEVIVVRIKNRFDLDYDAVETTGYRDISINLRIDNEVTWDMGVDTHVGEVKLLLTECAKLKSEVGHKNYVQWRNLRGE